MFPFRGTGCHLLAVNGSVLLLSLFGEPSFSIIQAVVMNEYFVSNRIIFLYLLLQEYYKLDGIDIFMLFYGSFFYFWFLVVHAASSLRRVL